MRLSIIVPVLNSHEIVRRQILHFKQMDLPDDIEIIYMDDGSEPPLSFPDHGLKNFSIYQTNDSRPWTWALARNSGARLAKGKYLLMTDLDYIIPKNAIESALEFNGLKMRFKREFGVLDETGNFTQDIDVLKTYGLLLERIKTRGVKLAPHPNNFVMRKDLFFAMGGYREDHISLPYPQGEDTLFKRTWAEWLKVGRVRDHDYRPTIYMFPNGRYCGGVNYNPFGLFHNLSRKSERNHWYKKNDQSAERDNSSKE